MKRNKTAVIGLGNRLLADEGAGLHALERLRERLDRLHGASKPDVDLLDAGTPGFNLLHQFDGRKKIIFIDAGNCGVRPGQYRRFIPEQVVSRKKTARHSLHEFDLIRFLEFAVQMEITGSVQVVIYCIQTARTAMSEKLSPAVEKNLCRLVEDVCGEVLKGTGHA